MLMCMCVGLFEIKFENRYKRIMNEDVKNKEVQCL